MYRANRHAALAAILVASAVAIPVTAIAATDAPPQQTVPEATGPGKSGSSSGPLSDKLDRTDGVLHPPSGVDPEISKRPPPTGPSSMPVIPPPGTPGGEPRVEPK